MDNKTIYALSTIFGKSGIAIIRISGRNAFSVFDQLTDIKAKNAIMRKMYHTKIYDNVSRETLDDAMIVAFKSPNSFTGEDTVEINCHGSKAVIRSIINTLSHLNDFRLAEAGEFSRRAFYNGKMDLTQADGLADLIDAETSLQQKVALQQMGGRLLKLYDDWRMRLIDIMSHIEAYIDFPDENLPENVINEMVNTVFKIKEEIEKHLKNNNIEERLRDGFNVVIAGPTNAGKSSLINALVQRNVAIVSDIAGTTRDVIEAHIDIKGIPIILSDTAGLRESDDTVEKMGIEIAKSRIKNADFNIFLFDATQDSPSMFTPYITSDNYLLAANKCDKLAEEQKAELVKNGCLLISAKENTNISDLSDKLYNYFNELYIQNSSSVITRQRYREALTECLEHLNRFNMSKEIELAAEDIRMACRAIGKITGQVEVDEILDKIFSSFCIGK